MKLNENFNQQEFIDWISGFLPDFSKDIRKVDVSKSFQGIKSIQTIGESPLGVRVYIIETEQDPSRRKIGLATESFTLLRDYGTPNAIIVYYSENSSLWRLSLLTSTLTWDEGKIKKKLSNPKRQSYVLGSKAKVKTPHQYLISKGSVTDFTDLKSRFSLEVVNKEFYKEISSAFIHLVGGQIANGKSKKTVEAQLKLPFVKDHSQTSQEFAVRLIGRIIFCWFLREKRSASGHSLMPRELLSFEASSTIEDYYHKILEPIFFEVLNKPIKTRKDAFINDLFSAIPYLNGGLFSPHDDDFFNYNEGKQAVNHNMVVLPDSWFISLFDVLETYNFTIDENTSFDEELSIDPEMLGRIFENLLAEINPDTGESIRKSTGSYYTPRVIVDYMVDESLKLYLNEKTNIDKEKLRALISYDLADDDSNPLNDEEKDKITQALGSIKILDPACGSGAFPIGMLQKIVFILQQIDQHGQLWFKKQIQNTPIELRKVIEREFQEKNFDYIRKLGIIRENIYGIDIQPIATEISRLRCFLTLVVDERIDDSLENRGIEPLPNLDFKFVTANTLFGLPSSSKSINQMGLFEDDQGIKELKEVRDMFFNASGFERDQLKLQFVQTQNRMFQKLINEGLRGHADMTAKLTTWDPFSHKSADWFDPEWMFGIKDGFDVVIANPPYDVYQGEKKDEIISIKKLDIYDLAKGGKLNLYKLFLAKSSQLQKQNGILCEIFQNSFLADNAAKFIRKYFLNEQTIVRIDSFPERDNHKKRVFEAVKMSVCILITSKVQSDDYSFKLSVWKSKHMDDGFTVDYLKSEIKKIDPVSFQIPLLESHEKSLFTKIYNHPHAPISCIEGELNMTFHKKYFTSDPQNPKIIKGAAIQRYRVTDKMSQGEVEYLNTNLYFKDFGQSKKSQHYKQSRLAMQGITGVDDKRRLVMTYLPSGVFCANSCNYVLTNDEKYSLYFLLGLYNSKLINWIFKKTSTNSNVNCYEIENLPTPILNEQNHSIVSEIENRVKLVLKHNSDYSPSKSPDITKSIESEIDKYIYTLYDLSNDEMSIIENCIL